MIGSGGCPLLFLLEIHMNDPITWKVEGSPNTHTIPQGAVVCVEGKNGKVLVWVDEDGWVNTQDDRKAETS